MPYFIICGKLGCPRYAHALHVAQYLNSKLPSFEYLKLDKNEKEWMNYVMYLNDKEKWHVTECPLIWREISMWGGKKYLIGSLSEFWEYVYCYYGLESTIPSSELKILADDQLKFKEQEDAKKKIQGHFVITISTNGAWGIVLLMFLNDLLKLNFVKENIRIRLYAPFSGADEMPMLLECVDGINHQKIFGNTHIICVASTAKEAFRKCNIAIHMYDYRRFPDEVTECWLYRCQDDMIRFADAIKQFAAPEVKVIFNDLGPICFMAGILVKYFPDINTRNVVGVTSNLGLSLLTSLSNNTGVPVRNIFGPPVWGYTGFKDFVDLRNTVFKSDIYRPYERALTSPEGSTLPLGSKKSELRLMSYLINDEACKDIIVTSLNKQILGELKLDRPYLQSKIRALLNLLDLWIGNDTNDDIISLAVESDGSFGIPSGLYFSQPVKLNEDRDWIPYANYPLIDNFTKTQINECIISGENIYKSFELDRRIDDGMYESETNMVNDSVVEMCEEIDESETNVVNDSVVEMYED